MHHAYADKDLEVLTRILCQLLGRDSMSENEDIYHAGIGSVMALPLLIEIESTFKLSIPDADFVKANTPRALAELIRRVRSQTLAR